MKNNYNPKKLSKRQRHMKKWIPDYHYCEGIYGKGCPFYKRVLIDGVSEYYPNYYNHKRNECQFFNRCDEDCSKCKQSISKCEYLNYTEYGQFPLGDMCKICGVHTLDRKEYRRNIHGHYFKARGWKGKRKRQEKFNKELKARMKWYPELWENDSYDKMKEIWRDLLD